MGITAKSHSYPHSPQPRRRGHVHLVGLLLLLARLDSLGSYFHRFLVLTLGSTIFYLFAMSARHAALFSPETGLLQHSPQPIRVRERHFVFDIDFLAHWVGIDLHHAWFCFDAPFNCLCITAATQVV